MTFVASAQSATGPGSPFDRFSVRCVFRNSALSGRHGAHDGHRPTRDAQPVPVEVRLRRKGPLPCRIGQGPWLPTRRRTATPGGGPSSSMPPRPRACPATRSASRAATSVRTCRAVGACIPPEEIVEGVFWPNRTVKPEFKAVAVEVASGQVIQGIVKEETAKELVLQDAVGKLHRIPKKEIEERREIGSLMPEGLTAAMTAEQRRDLIRYLLELGKTKGLEDLSHEPVEIRLQPRTACGRRIGRTERIT